MSVKAKNIFKNKTIQLPVPMCVTGLNQCDKIAFLKVALKNSDLHEELINEFKQVNELVKEYVPKEFSAKATLSLKLMFLLFPLHYVHQTSFLSGL
jgi:hypothetical protein